MDPTIENIRLNLLVEEIMQHFRSQLGEKFDSLKTDEQILLKESSRVVVVTQGREQAFEIEGKFKTQKLLSEAVCSKLKSEVDLDCHVVEVQSEGCLVDVNGEKVGTRGFFFFSTPTNLHQSRNTAPVE